MNKKQIRKQFRDDCFRRDEYKCVICGKSGELDAHHITDRKEMPHGGYVKENGISLCSTCHQKAEEFHSTGIAHPGFAPDDLYRAINSNYKTAIDSDCSRDCRRIEL